jgi:hypothetical protein
MSRTRVNKRCFSRKTNVGKNPTQLYVWCVDTNLAQVPGTGVNRGGAPAPFCNATKGSQGYDNITGYVYELVVVSGIQQKLAYVECDYVQ